jgi:hypothetical protein
VPEGTPGATVLAVKRVNELDFYSLSFTEIVKKLGITAPKAGALMHKLGIYKSDDYYKKIKIGKSSFDRYSPKALDCLLKALPAVDISVVWEEYKASKK